MSNKNDQTGEDLTGAQSLVRSLELAGAETVFGIPGGAILPAYDPLYDSQSGPAHPRPPRAGRRDTLLRGTPWPPARWGSAWPPRDRGRPTSSPRSPTPTWIRCRWSRSPARCRARPSGPTPSRRPTSAASHADHQDNFLVTKTADIAGAIASAFHIAGTGRPGPVLVDIAKDALQAKTPFVWPRQLDLPGYRPVTKPHGKQVREAAKLIMAARRPVLYVGGGGPGPAPRKELRTLAELTRIPLVTTLMARGVFPDSHAQNMGMPGMHGTVAAVGALQRSDLLISLGARFDDRVTGQLATFAPGVGHPRRYRPRRDLQEPGGRRPIVGDCKEVITELTGIAPDRRRAARLRRVDAVPTDLKRRYPTGYDEPDDGTLSPQHVIQRIGELLDPMPTMRLAGPARCGRRTSCPSNFPDAG